MYRCFHCHDLHVSSDQARSCSTSDPDWFDAALQEVDRILERGPVPWRVERAGADATEWTLAERRMLAALEEAMPGEVRSRWSVPGCDHHVDFFIPAASLAVQIDGPSDTRALGADRLRSAVLRSNGVTVIRIPDSLALSDGDRIAGVIAARTRTDAMIDDLPEPREADALA